MIMLISTEINLGTSPGDFCFNLSSSSFELYHHCSVAPYWFLMDMCDDHSDYLQIQIPFIIYPSLFSTLVSSPQD